MYVFYNYMYVFYKYTCPLCMSSTNIYTSTTTIIMSSTDIRKSCTNICICSTIVFYKYTFSTNICTSSTIICMCSTNMFVLYKYMCSTNIVCVGLLQIYVISKYRFVFYKYMFVFCKYVSATKICISSTNIYIIYKCMFVFYNYMYVVYTYMTIISQLAFYVNLHRAVIGPSATLTGRWRPDIDLRRMLTGMYIVYKCMSSTVTSTWYTNTVKELYTVQCQQGLHCTITKSTKYCRIYGQASKALGY